MITSGSIPKALSGGSKMSDECEMHHEKFAGKPHPDAKHVPSHLPEHRRATPPPARHTKGKFPSQLNSDHGPHK